MFDLRFPALRLPRLVTYCSSVHGCRPAFLRGVYESTDTARVVVLMPMRRLPYGGVVGCGVPVARVRLAIRVRVNRRVGVAA